MENSKYEGESPWSTGLCDCCSDVSVCCMTIFCPCITFGRSAEIINKGTCGESCLLYCLLHHITAVLPSIFYGCIHRRRLRGQYGLKQSPCNDFLVYCFCHYRALCQEYRQLKYQGFDMKRGWKGNQNPGVTMAPVTGGGMKR
ncbi:cell number regulator 2 [Gossypium australe]|uniref:Cell number regulator 2 n=1 Tax=Gossypium australe TaxID=47621 RepID=A0A5B6V0Q1_9ROSI|nr:cell number regulator 2 [Gossypium australe]